MEDSNHNSGRDTQANGKPATSWISRGFEQLVYELENSPTSNSRTDYDVVIIGSGYGGAIAAAELAGCKDNKEAIRLCVLERGSEYLPGMFPSRMADLPGHVRGSLPNSVTPMGRREGLFDIRVGADVSALVANGLGGGSLINAGVMEKPLAAVFNTHWPDAIKNASAARDSYYQRAKQLLGAANGKADNSIECHEHHEKQALKKYQALQALAKGSAPKSKSAGFRPAAVTIAMSDRQNSAGVTLNKCKLCGDCVTGCNHGAKDSLDVNLLHKAWRAGAEIYTGATVLRITQDQETNNWLVQVTYSDKKLRARQGKPVDLKARRIILAAGTLGSTEILLRSASNDLKFSAMLGRRFSSNGDMLAAAYDQKKAVDAIADEQQAADERKHGPCITAVIDLREEQDSAGVLIEELAIPAPLQRVFHEVFTTSNSLHTLAEGDTKPHTPGRVKDDPLAVNDAAMRKTSVFAVMGDDGAEGALELDEEGAEADSDNPLDGSIRIRWPNVGRKALFDTQISTLQTLTKNSKIGGRIVANPLWRLLPDSMSFLLDQQQGPLLTVHPLGGCPMGNDVHGGVVDSCGRVFNANAINPDKPMFEGLVVLDGSIVPTALGTNPALTIAALALRAVETLREEWQFEKPATDAKLPAITPRPVFRAIAPTQAAIATEVQVLERLAGEVVLTSTSGTPLRRIIELTLYFEDTQLQQLTRLNAAGQLQDPLLRVKNAPAKNQQSMLRIFKPAAWHASQRRNLSGQQLEAELAKIAEFCAPLSGTLTLFSREQSSACQRRRRALHAWLWNRGLRDTWQWLAETIRAGGLFNRSGGAGLCSEIKKRAANSLALASHAGEVRLLEYDLQAESGPDDRAAYRAQLAGISAQYCIRGVKRLTYSRRCNPWRQLSEMTLLRFPGLQADVAAPTLELDTSFLARKGVPLLRIVKQHDQLTALADLASFGAYFVRLLLSVHIWSFRKPDTPKPQEPQRLPGKIDGLPDPVIKEIEVDLIRTGKVDGIPKGTPVKVRLSRYPRYGSAQPPVVMIHGYSASGTSFAHHAVNPNLATHFWQQQRDVWILDLRTSCGMPTARHPWTFEEAALADIPVAVDYIYCQTGRQAIDVIAHCMGSAMFSMAVLSASDVKEGDKFALQRRELPGRIRKVVLSQVGPAVVFSPANIFRTYLASFLKNFLPLSDYTFRVGPEPSLGDELLDRLLATLPYPAEEFALENPAWPPWRRTAFVGTRHRMDALYGRDFSLANIDASVLDYIDDLFGPLNIDTVSQAIHFAKLKTITNRSGRNVFLNSKNLQRHWKFPTLCVHGEDNGLADVATVYRMQHVLRQAGCDISVEPVAGFGHQDCLLGRNASEVFTKMHSFLQGEHATSASSEIDDASAQALLAAIPWSGPVIGCVFNDESTKNKLLPVMLGASPTLGAPELVVFLPVQRGNNGSIIPAPAQQVSSAEIVVPQPEPDDASAWLKMTIPAPLVTGKAGGVMAFLIYEQMEGLENPAFGENLLDEFAAQDAASCAIQGGRGELAKTIAQALSAGEDTHASLRALGKQRVVDAIATTLTQSGKALQRGLIEYPVREHKTGADVCFAFASCQYPGGLFDRALAYASYQRLADRLDNDELARPDFLLLAGDQIYVDATADLFDPTIEDDRYVRPYNRLLRNAAVRSVLRRLPSYTMLDDHEIENNWERGSDDADLQQAKKAYLRFQRGINHSRSGSSTEDSEGLWYDFVENGIPFFMLDTRTDRKQRTAASAGEATILGAGQCARLEQWLLELHEEHADSPKFIVSPSILLPRHSRVVRDDYPTSALRQDGWDGYPNSLHRLLAFIADREISNVVFLSGDEHLSCVAQATIQNSTAKKETTIHSIHSSALYAPFSFANSVPEDLVASDEFEFKRADNSQHEYRCSVTADFIPGDGFALLSVTRGKGEWKICCEFDRVQTVPPVCIDLDG